MTEITSTSLQDADDCNNNGSKYQHTPLSLGCWTGDLKLTTYLIDEGADPNGKTLQGILPLHFCCMGSKSVPILLYLLEHHRITVDINAATDGEGKTPLMYASSCGLEKTVQILLGKKAEVNKQDGRGQSAIFYAVRGGHVDILQQLISHDACVQLRDDDNANLLHHLMGSHLTIPRKSFEEILTYLVEQKGLDINTKMLNGTTALHKACQFGLVSIAQYLISKGGNLEAKKDSWETPVWSHVKSLMPKRDMIMMLFDKGANFHVKNPIGMTLLDYSTKYLENEELTETLLEVQKILKRRRMEAMRAKRKAIWNDYERASPVIQFTSPPKSPVDQVDQATSGPELSLVNEENKMPKSGNEKLSEAEATDSSSTSSSSSDSSDSSTTDDDDSSSDSSSLSSVSSDDNREDKAKSTNTVQVSAVSTTASREIAMAARQQQRKIKNTSSKERISGQTYADDDDEGIINISSDESDYDTETAGTSSKSGAGMPRRSQRSFGSAKDNKVQPQRITRKRKAVVITLSDSD